MTIFEEISEEREYQDMKWGGPVHDDTSNTLNDWRTLITNYATRNYDNGYILKVDVPDSGAFRTDMIKVAALAVAAIEATDRALRSQISTEPVV